MIGDYYIVEDDNEVRKLVCLVSEKIIMYDWLTAKENLWFFGRLYDVQKEVLLGTSQCPPIEDILRAIKDLTHSMHVVEATELAKEAGAPIMQNVAMVGCLAGSEFTPVRTSTLQEVIGETFAKRHLEANLKAFELGVKEIRRISAFS